MDEIRLNKYLAQSGVCSRREADKLVEMGVVSVNGKVASIGQLVTEKDKVAVRGKSVKPVEEKVVLAFYKPIGVTCTEKDKNAKLKITDVLKYPTRLTYAGRLDQDSEGLLLMTNDGDLIEQMMRGSNGHEKEYVVTLNRKIDAKFKKRMEEGIYLRELKRVTKPCKIELLSDTSFKIILTQGWNRQIRRMCSYCGYEVKSLKRVRVISILLGDLKPGEYRKLNEKEVKDLYLNCKE